jgi:hypothetical protein
VTGFLQAIAIAAGVLGVAALLAFVYLLVRSEQ